MTPLPELEPAALEAACKEYARFFAHCRAMNLEDTLHHVEQQWSRYIYELSPVIRAYLAARSVPEAGKAVDETLTALSGFLVFLKDMRFAGSWDLPTLNRAIEVGETIAEQQAALASVPAPSGAIDELIAIDEVDRDMIARGDRIGADLQRALLKFHDEHAAIASVPAPSGAEQVAIEIADAVLAWLVERGIIDPDNEYRASDVVAALEDAIS